MLFELDKYEERLRREPPARPELPYQHATDVEQASLLYWAEHCVECAAPGCYESCDLYQPRIDTRCRRFTFGAFKNRNFPSRRGYGVEVSFKKWAKMEAFGNLGLMSPTSQRASERLVEWVSPSANVAGGVMSRLTRKARWKALTNEGLEALVRRMDRGQTNNFRPDAFLLEIYNPATQTVRMQLSFSPIAEETNGKSGLVQIARGFTQTVVCLPGYTRHEVGTALIRGAIEGGPFVVRMIPEADNEARLVFLSAEFVKFKTGARSGGEQTKNVKCVVFDLDNTLWKGVLVENDEVEVQPEVARLIKHLDERGILLSIASKNDHESALQKLQEAGLDEYFLYPQISWNPKSKSVRTIAERLNIGVDSLAFVDDNPFELDEVGKSVPEVVCVNASHVESLFSDERFQGSSTAEAQQRRQLYREADARETAYESFGSDYLGFLTSCEIELEIAPYSAKEAERVAELVQRTNQLNFSGKKYSREEMEAIVANPALEKLVLKCADRYGSHGTVGFCIVEKSKEAIKVQDFMLSCRVQGKLVEQALFHHLVDRHNPEGLKRFSVNFRATARNKPAQRVLESLGFRVVESEAGDSRGMELRELESLRCDVIRVRCDCLSGPVSSESTTAPSVL